MHQVLEQIIEFKDKLEFIADNLDTAASFIEMKSMSQSEKYAIVEPYIEMLMASASSADVKEVSELISEKHEQIACCLKEGSKIEAIKEFRACFGTGLKDSKDEIERVYDKTLGFRVDRWEYNGFLIWKK